MGRWDDAPIGAVWARARRRDPEAMAAIVRRFQALVYSVPRRIGLPEDDCADIFQNTFQALFSASDRIESAEALPKWLATTASRQALRLARSNRAKVSLDPALEDSLVSLDDVEDAVHREAQATWEAFVLRQALAKVPEKCQALVRALFFEEWDSYDEVAERLGVPRGAIGPTRSRCLEKLKRQLLELGFMGDVSDGEGGAL